VSPSPRRASSWTATALIPVLCAVPAAPPASAFGCSGAAAAAQPGPGQDVQIPNPGKIAPFTRPIGHRPVGANDQAPPPTIGQLLARAVGQAARVVSLATAPASGLLARIREIEKREPEEAPAEEAATEAPAKDTPAPEEIGEEAPEQAEATDAPEAESQSEKAPEPQKTREPPEGDPDAS